MSIFFILILSTFLRFFQLGQNPPSLTWDEVAWGYNAYSIGIDGRDEFGRFLPLNYLESFGDFKPPVYAYLDILPVKIFGLNEFAVRFPSAFFGVLTVIVTYFLVKRLFQGYKKFSIFNFQFSIGEIAAFILAISPWHINLSRAAFEANIATFFLVTGVWLFLGAVQDRKWYLPFSIISFVLSLYTFNSVRVVAPLLLLGLAIGFTKKLMEIKREVMISVVLGVILLIPVLPFLLSPQASLRFKEVNIFSDIGVIEKTNQQINNDGGVWWSKIIHNRRLAYGTEFLKHYFDNLSPNFLFIKGDGNPKFSTQDVGQLYLWDLPFLLLGVLVLFKLRQKNWWILPFWLLIGIIPAATARETPHALRTEAVIPTFQILIALGVFNVINIISNIKYQIRFNRIQILNTQIKYSIYALLFLFLMFNFLYYYHGYYAHYPREYSGEWQYGYKESIDYVKSVEGNYDQINITDKLGRPYIYYLFYTQTKPGDFRKSLIVNRDVFGFVNVLGFNKFQFKRDNYDYSNKGKRALYIGTPSEVPASATILKVFHLLNGNQSLIAYTL